MSATVTKKANPAVRDLIAGRRTRPAVAAVATIAAWLLLRVVLPYGAPLGTLLQGAVLGAINALVAITIVLVYRANRAINFAAAEFGSVAGVVAIELHVKGHLNYFLSIAAGVVLAAIIGAVIEVTVIRRFAQAPRLIVAVATIGLAQLLNGLSVLIPIELNKHTTGSGGTFTTPFKVHFYLFPVLFDGNYIFALVVVPVAMVGLTYFLKYTDYGVAIRASADNGDRARLLGVPTARLSAVVWAITGVLSSMAVLLRIPILGFVSFTSVSGGGLDLLLQTLTAAVLAGMTSLPVAVIAAVGLGVAEQLGAWTFHNSTFIDASLFAIILIVLLVKRDKLSRATETGIGNWQAIKQIRGVPPELISLPEVRIGRSAARLGVLAIGLVLPFLITPARAQLASVVLIYAMVAASLVVLTGWAGHISLGQVAFMGFGGATTGVLVAVHHWDLFLALLAGMAVAAVVAVLIGLPALRVSGPFLAVTTLAFAVTAGAYFLVPKYFPWFDPTAPVTPPTLFGRISISSDRQMYYVCFVALVMVLVGLRTLRASHVGRAIISAKENRLASQSFGLDTTRLNLLAFALSGSIAGLAGGLFVVQQQAYNFSAFPAADGLVFFTMVVIGGLGSLPGAVLGAIYVYGSLYLLPAGYSFLATGFGLLLLLLFLPGGLGELVFRGRDRLLRVVAARRGILVPSLVADKRVVDPEQVAAEAAAAAEALGVAPPPGSRDPDTAEVLAVVDEAERALVAATGINNGVATPDPLLAQRGLEASGEVDAPARRRRSAPRTATIDLEAPAPSNGNGNGRTTPRAPRNGTARNGTARNGTARTAAPRNGTARDDSTTNGGQR